MLKSSAPSRYAVGDAMNPPSSLVPTLDLVHSAEAIEIAYRMSRMRVLERIPGNPIGIAFRAIDEGAIAFMAQHLPSPWFNGVSGLRAGHERHVQPLVEWYRDHSVKVRFVLEPGDYGAGLGRELLRLGYLPTGFH